MELVGDATNGLDALQEYRRLLPDIILVDVQLPLMNGIDLITALREEFPRCACIVLTTYDNPIHIVRAVRAGARGFLLKTMLRRQMLDAIQIVHRGGRFFPETIADTLDSQIREEELSAREIEILRCVADGLSNNDIGNAVGITENTVKSHLKTITSKLRANDRTHAVLIALRKGFLDLSQA
jgi:DNA-binding NarL/FixJ family response regulator